jgi:release factor glutamine methyltransferase
LETLVPTSSAVPDVVGRLRAAGCVFAEDEARLLHDATRTPAELDALVDRRAAGEPLEHLLGWVEFAGLRLAVDAGVFVPRRRTELLAREAAALAAPGSVVVELCCGVCAVGAAVIAAVPGIDLHAADVDPVAVRCARRNVPGARVYEGDLDAPLPVSLHGRVDVLVANAPYVPTGAVAMMPPEARLHEPLVALDGGADGLDVQRRVIAATPLWLAPGGHLLIETSEAQSPHTAAAMEAAGLHAQVVRDEERDATAVIATRPPRTLEP